MQGKPKGKTYYRRKEYKGEVGEVIKGVPLFMTFRGEPLKMITYLCEDTGCSFEDAVIVMYELLPESGLYAKAQEHLFQRMKDKHGSKYSPAAYIKKIPEHQARRRIDAEIERLTELDRLAEEKARKATRDKKKDKMKA